MDATPNAPGGKLLPALKCAGVSCSKTKNGGTQRGGL